jgi:hypothetical protein
VAGPPPRRRSPAEESGRPLCASYPVDVPVFVLSVHADYACRHAGACCTAGWRIPVDRACEDRLMAARLARTTEGGAPFERDASDTVIALASDGACAFFERPTQDTPPLCAVHRVLGHDALPSACRHFPRVAVTDDAGTFVTLSHYCPTAAVMLFGSDEALLSIVEAPDAFHPVTEYEGLDARGALPPLLRPGMLSDLESHHEWERHAVRVFANAMHTPESALEQLTCDADTLRAWLPAHGSLGDRLARLGDGGPGRPEALPHDRLTYPPRQLHETVRSCIAPGLDAPPAPENLDEVDALFVEPAWDFFAAPIKRYLAAKAFASWIPWQARGVRSMVAALRAARGVLRVEAGRQCAAAGRVLDRHLLIEAIRQSDLLVVHKVSSELLAKRLAPVEAGEPGLWQRT